MKISKLRIRNLFGIKEFSSDGKDIELDGKKGVGKSSVIDAIKLALTNRSPRDYVILQGETEGEVYIQTDSGLSIHRKVRTNKTDYKSIKQEGEKGDKNESFLREIYTELQLNPIEFSKMDPAEQNRIILDLIDFEWNMDWIQKQFGEIPPEVNYEQNILCVLYDIQKNEGYYFKTREDKNRDIRNNKAFVEEIGKALPENYNAKKWEAVNLGDIYKQIESIRSGNEAKEKAKAKVASRDTGIKEIKLALEVTEKEIEQDALKATNDFNIRIGEIEKEVERNKSTLTTTISDIQRDTAKIKSDLEKEIIELENKLAKKRQDIIDLTPKMVHAIETATKDSEASITASREKINQVMKDIETAKDSTFSKLEIARQTYKADVATLEGDIKPHEELAKLEPVPFDKLQEEADYTEKMKSYINEYKRMVTLQETIERLNTESNNLTAKIEKARELPGVILATANIPIEGLSVKEGIALINGLPISNLSDGEKFELCINVALRNSNSLNMILLNGIECLSTTDRENIYKTLKEKGVQFIASRTTDDDLLTVVEL